MSHPLYAAPKQRSIERVPHTAYQVDYVAVNCGKLVPSSKRRIRFKFGYTDMDALSNGKIGQECRGSEHEVIITWSLSSGKQAIAFDQREVYFDVGESTQSKIKHCWKDPFGHVLEVKVHAASMSTKANPDPDWKQYDLLVDGVSFFRMPKIFQIGVVAKDEASDDYNHTPKFAKYPSSRTAPNEAVRYRNDSKNNVESLLPPDEPERPEPKHVVDDLLSFDEFDIPGAVVAAPPQPTAPFQSNYTQAQELVQTNYASIQAPTQAYAPAQAPAQPSCAPAQFQPNYAPTNPFHNPQANYISPNSSPARTGSSPFGEPSNAALSTSATYAPQPNPVTPPRYFTTMNPVQPAPSTFGADGAVKNLVNMDDLFGPSAAAPVTKRPNHVIDNNNSLGQLQGSNSGNPKKPVMNTFNPAPAYQHQQGMYYGYAAQQQQQPQYNNYPHQQAYAQPQPGQ